MPLGLHLPLISLALAAITWLLCSLLARRLGRASLLRALLLRVRLSLAIPLLLGGELLWLLRLLPPTDLPLPSAQELRQLLVVVALAWSLARCRGTLLVWVESTAAVAALEGRERLALLDLLDKLIGLLVAVLLGWQVLRLLGVSAGVLLTAGGFGAAALAFGARTIVENGLSGVGLYLSRPFVVGDVIRLPAQQLQGEVEAIGWFHTRLRDPERQTVYIPNGTFISQAVQNLAQIDRRRLELEVSLRPRDRDAVPAIVAELQGLLAAEPAVDPGLPARVPAEAGVPCRHRRPGRSPRPAATAAAADRHRGGAPWRRDRPAFPRPGLREAPRRSRPAADLAPVVLQWYAIAASRLPALYRSLLGTPRPLAPPPSPPMPGSCARCFPPRRSSPTAPCCPCRRSTARSCCWAG
jgi:MscS family membrane protein